MIPNNGTNVATHFMKTMSRIGTQAMILTSGTKRSGSELHGMTLSSVSSLSVFPRPLIQFNLHLPSYTAQFIDRNKYLAIHMMPPTLSAVHLSRIFASGVKQNKKKASECKDGEEFHEMTTPFKQIDEKEWEFYNIDGVHVPILKESERALVCKAIEHITIDSHQICIAEVIDILTPNKNYKDLEPSGGLLYCNRKFYTLGNSM